VFHAVSAFNKAGFGLYADSLMQFVGDPLIYLPICAAIIVGGLGFPVLFEMRRELRTRVAAHQDHRREERRPARRRLAGHHRDGVDQPGTLGRLSFSGPELA
jgi:Trk-type K+ transport system membrane component